MTSNNISILHLRRPLDMLLSKLAQNPSEQTQTGPDLDLNDEILGYLVYIGAQFSTMIFSALEVSLPLQTELWVGFQQPVLRLYREDTRGAAADHIYKHISYFYKVFLQRLIEYCPDCIELQQVCRVFDISIPKTAVRFNDLPKAIYVRTAHDAVCRVGDLSRYRGRLSNATVYYKLATRLLPGSGVALNQLGNIKYRAGELHDALFYFAKSVSVREPASDSNLRVVLRKIVRPDSSENGTITRIFRWFARVYLDINTASIDDNCIGCTETLVTETGSDADFLAKLAVTTICFAHLTQSGTVLVYAVDTIHTLLDIYATTSAVCVLPALHVYVDWLAKNPTVATEVDSLRLMRCIEQLRDLKIPPQCSAAESVHAEGIEFLNGGITHDSSRRSGRITGILTAAQRVLDQRNYHLEQTRLRAMEKKHEVNMSKRKQQKNKGNETKKEQENDEEIVFLGRH